MAMLVWLMAAAACCAASIAVKALDAAAKLRLAFLIANCSALFWVGLRFASIAYGAVA